MSDENETRLKQLIEDFRKKVEVVAGKKNIRKAEVRSRLNFNSVIIVDDKSIIWLAEPLSGPMSSIRVLSQPGKVFSSVNMEDIALYDFGFSSYFFVMFPKEIIKDDCPEERKGEIITSIALEHIRSEVERVLENKNLIQINPIFGPPSYKLNQNMIFVLMPFLENLTKIYNEIIKPTVESKEIGLVCRRADEINSTKAIMQDIWKNICEARFIVADVTSFNANVMYELGIAHAIGKETILIYQNSSAEKNEFPFDLNHIRRIEYTDTAIGGTNLRKELEKTINNLLSIRSS